MKGKKKLVYLASPYSKYAERGENGLQFATDEAARAAAELMQSGYAVFCPVVHSHYIADVMPSTTRLDHNFWMDQDLAVLRHCDEVFVLCMFGWRDSKGIAQEIAFAKSYGIPVRYFISDAGSLREIPNGW